jgi:peptide/nickel transport system permease protein|tara:strand:- start:48 stop:932 length:885 start_codon:yes stop_codon:yes gene_type:complete
LKPQEEKFLPVLQKWKQFVESFSFLTANSSVMFGGSLLLFVATTALLAPILFTVEPTSMHPIDRLQGPSQAFWFGTDMYGRDTYSRTIFGCRISLVVGFSVAVLSISIGLVIGLVAGYLRWLDAIVMRIMDGIMAIPGILLAIAMLALAGASLQTVILAITIPEIPRVVRLVRGIVLGLREEPYVESAISLGTRTPQILIRHILPNIMAPLIVQGTYVCASAMILEAILSFLGAGVPPETPSWGNIMAEGKSYFQIAPWIIFFPGVYLALTVLGVNVLGDGLRDTLDPRLAKQL